LRDLTEQKRLTVLQMEQARIISLVNEVGSHLLGSLPLRDAMQQCAQALVSLFPGAFIRLRLSHQPESMLEVQASSGAVAELMLTQATIGPVLLDRLHQERKLLVSNNVTAEPWWEKKPDQKLEGVQAFYGCPLQSGEQLLGVLALFAPRPLPTPMVELFRSLVQQITLGLARHEALLRQPTVQTVVDTAAAEKHAQAEAALRQEIEKQLATIRTLEEQLRTLQETPPPPPAMQTAPPNLEVERQQYEARLQEAQAAARRSDQARQEFLTTMSQEIRSPLTAILGQTDILLDPHLETTDRLKALKGIKRNSEQLLHVMNDLLDLSRIETGQLQLERLPCSPWQLVQEVLLSLHNAAQEKGVQLSILPSGPLPRQITTDPTRLRQIVHHLVRNALHATAKGQVTVRVGIQSQESDARLQITVEDESGGFTPEELERLFSPLPIFDSAFIRKVGGSGLGLSIAQRLARRLDGDLTAHPQPNQGNLFMLRLPLAPAELDDKQTEEEMTLNTTLFKSLPLPEPKTKLQGRALLIERHKDNQRVMAYFLERLGLSTEIAPTAETALEWLAEEDFDLLLLDLEQPSPELDGPQLARLLRDKNYTQPLLGLLARSHINAEQRALEAGCDGILFKPVEQETWQNTLSRFLKTAPAETTPQQVPPAAPTEPPIISTYQEDNDFMHLVRDYAGSLTGRLAELRAALKVGDMARVIKLGHLLKGSAATYGYPILSVMAGELEQAAYHGGDGPRLNDRLDAIAHTVERIQHAFQKETVLQGR
jgi:signal transduction histidine kinase/CheY-like chemotaxis protein/HPt (histidine-containing phosphotransfer) domain-containing protein